MARRRIRIALSRLCKVVGTPKRAGLAKGDSVQANQLGVRLVLWAGIVPAPVPAVGARSDRKLEIERSGDDVGGFSSRCGRKNRGVSSIFCAVRSFWWGAGSSSAC